MERLSNLPTPESIRLMKIEPKYIFLAVTMVKNMMEKPINDLNLPAELIWNSILNIKHDNVYPISMDTEFVWESMEIFASGLEYKSIENINIYGSHLMMNYRASDGKLYPLEFEMTGVENGRLNLNISSKNQRILMGVFEDHAPELVGHLTIKEYDEYYDRKILDTKESNRVNDRLEARFLSEKGLSLKIPRSIFNNLLDIAINKDMMKKVRKLSFDWVNHLLSLEFHNSLGSLNFKMDSFSSEFMEMTLLSTSPANLANIVLNTPLKAIPNLVRILKLKI
jgi:hypothetical protein